MYVTPKFPKGGTKRDFSVFASKIQLVLKEAATKFLCVKTSSGRVVATSFPYLMVHRWIAGDVPFYLKFALRVTHPFNLPMWPPCVVERDALSGRAGKRVRLCPILTATVADAFVSSVKVSVALT